MLIIINIINIFPNVDILSLLSKYNFVNNEKTRNIPINPKKRRNESKDECGNKNDSVLFIIFSPYSWPKLKGPLQPSSLNT